MIAERLDIARAASAADTIAAVSALLPRAVALDPARLPLARSWLLSAYLPAWAAEAGVAIDGRDLVDIEADAGTAWRANREAARASRDPATWPALCDELRDVVREAMQTSVETAVRLPIGDAGWPALAARVWSTVEASIWAVAWRAVAVSEEAVSLVVPPALLPLRLALQHSAAALVLGVTPTPPKVVPAPHVEDGVLFNADGPVLAFMADHLPSVREWGPCSTLGILRDGALIGGVVFNNYYPELGDVEISAAFATGAWFRPRTLCRVFAYPFVDLGCQRLTDHVPRKLKAARRFAEKAGFRLEGVKRRAAANGSDLMLYGLLKEDCRFLGGHRHG